MARGVADVNLDALVVDSGNLCEDRNSAFSLQIVGVHNAIGEFFVGAENAALTEHGVHQRGLSMVYVRNNSDVSNLVR